MGVEKEISKYSPRKIKVPLIYDIRIMKNLRNVEDGTTMAVFSED